MSSWPVVVIPAIITALVVRLDAKLIGPYFALSSLIGGTEGIWADCDYNNPALRKALIRRFLYPALLGFALAWFEPSTADLAATGALAAGLLIWPLVFQGLPMNVSRRDWELPILYLSFFFAFPLLAICGASLKKLLVALSNGDVPHWLLEQALSLLIYSVLALMFSGLYSAMFRRVRTNVNRRGELAYDNESKRGDESLDFEEDNF